MLKYSLQKMSVNSYDKLIQMSKTNELDCLFPHFFRFFDGYDFDIIFHTNKRIRNIAHGGQAQLLY